MQVIVTKKNRKPAGGYESDSGGSEDQTPPDGMLDRIIKLVPAEVIAGYTALLAITSSISKEVDASIRFAIPAAIAAFTILIPLIFRRLSKQQGREVPWPQYVFSVLAFWVWAVSIRDPFVAFGCEIPTWIPAFGCVLLPLFGSYLIDFTDSPPEP